MKGLIKIYLYIMILFSGNVYATVANDLNNFFDTLGYSGNVTSPAYEGQKAGYYTGGSLFMRSPTRDVQLLQVELPSFRSGCGGIDVFGGSFSFINGEQMVQLMQNIMNNAGSYAFTLALETASPALANVMKYWNDFQSKINQENINSCEMAENLVGGLWPKVRGAQERVCQDIGNSKGIFSDWAAARQGCSTGNEFSSTMNKGRNDEHYKQFVFDSGNVTWKAIKQNKLFSSDDELAEFFMSLAGTIILAKDKSSDDANVSMSPRMPSLMDREHNNLIKAFLEGGNIEIYKCDTTDENGCLHPHKATIPFEKSKAFGQRIKTILVGMVDKVIADEKELNDQEKALLNSTSLPVYKMLNVQAAFAKNKDIIDIKSYADIIASDIIFQYLEQSLQIIRKNISGSQYPDAIIDEFRPNIASELEELRLAQKNAYERMTMTLMLVEKTQAIERMLAGSLSSELGNSLAWAHGLK